MHLFVLQFLFITLSVYLLNVGYFMINLGNILIGWDWIEVVQNWGIGNQNNQVLKMRTCHANKEDSPRTRT